MLLIFGGVDRLVSRQRVIGKRPVFVQIRPGSSGGNTENVGGVVAPNVQGCSHNTFMNGKPYPFNGTEGVVGLSHWIEKLEQVFEISKCAEGDKVMFGASTFEGRALTNRIPWNEFKSKMTTEYYPTTEIQRMEQEPLDSPFEGWLEQAIVCKALHRMNWGKVIREKWEDHQGNNNQPEPTIPINQKPKGGRQGRILKNYDAPQL
ncbi:hypothetical protein Tco_0828895 [Tanacetum coccineum]